VEVTMADESVKGTESEGEEPKDPSGKGGADRKKDEAPPEEGGPDRGSGGAALQRPPADS
jgi:hypothetical protein